MLFTCFTDDCNLIYLSNSIIKCAEDTAVVGLVSNEDESDYKQEEIICCSGAITIPMSQELVIDFKKSKVKEHSPLHIQGEAVKMEESLKFLKSTNSQLAKRAQ